jgi:hypothetical protein
VTDEHIREVAEVYLAAKITQPRQARQAVADHFRQTYPDKYGDLGAPNDHRVKSWIQAATNCGLIPKKGQIPANVATRVTSERQTSGRVGTAGGGRCSGAAVVPRSGS